VYTVIFDYLSEKSYFYGLFKDIPTAQKALKKAGFKKEKTRRFYKSAKHFVVLLGAVKCKPIIMAQIVQIRKNLPKVV